jgi:hypothetical protein
MENFVAEEKMTLFKKVLFCCRKLYCFFQQYVETNDCIKICWMSPYPSFACSLECWINENSIDIAQIIASTSSSQSKRSSDITVILRGQPHMIVHVI